MRAILSMIIAKCVIIVEYVTPWDYLQARHGHYRVGYALLSMLFVLCNIKFDNILCFCLRSSHGGSRSLPCLVFFIKHIICLIVILLLYNILYMVVN